MLLLPENFLCCSKPFHVPHRETTNISGNMNCILLYLSRIIMYFFFWFGFKYKYKIATFFLHHINILISPSFSFLSLENSLKSFPRIKSLVHLQNSCTHLSTYLWLLKRYFPSETKTHLYAVSIQCILTYRTFVGMSYKPLTSVILKRVSLSHRQSRIGCRVSRSTFKIYFLTP
jgi:hypothetical protein